MTGATGPGRMRVAIDASRGLEPRPTGTENYARQLTAALVERGAHEYTLYMRSAPAARSRMLKALADAPTGAEMKLLRAPRLWTHTRLAWAVARDGPDLLFVPAHVAPAVCRPPFVVTVHDLGHRAFPQSHTAAQRLYLEWSTRRHARHAAGVVADSRATATDLERWYGVAPERITVAHLGVDAGFRPTGKQEAQRWLGELRLPAEARYILHVGTRQPRKNLDRLVAAFARIASERDLHLVLAGPAGWGAVDAAGKAAACGVQRRVHVLDYVPREALPALYTMATAYALPSLHEGFGMTALEAMACGTPVVGSATSSIPEVVADTGLLVDPLDESALASALARMADDHKLRAVLGAAARRRAAGFTWGATAKAVESAFAAAGPRTAVAARGVDRPRDGAATR